MMDHIGESEKAKKLDITLDVCTQFEKKLIMTGRSTSAIGDSFAQYVLDTMDCADME